MRKDADAQRLKSEFGANFTPLMFDITDEAAVLSAVRDVRAAINGDTLAGLVNNAGIAVAGPVLEISVEQFRRQMEVMSLALSLRPRPSARCSARMLR